MNACHLMIINMYIFLTPDNFPTNMFKFILRGWFTDKVISLGIASIELCKVSLCCKTIGFYLFILSCITLWLYSVRLCHITLWLYIVKRCYTRLGLYLVSLCYITLKLVTLCYPSIKLYIVKLCFIIIGLYIGSKTVFNNTRILHI